MKTVAIFSGFFLPHLGGVEKYTNNMAIELKKNGYNVIIVTNNDNNYKNKETKDGIKVVRLPVYKLFKNRFPILKIFSKEYKSLKKEILSNKIDIVLINTRFYFTSVLGCNIAKKKKIKSYVIEHGSAHLTLNNKFLDFFIRTYEHIITFIVKKKCTGFIGASTAGNEWLKHFKVTSIETWNNAIVNKIDSSIIKKSKDKVIFAFAGRMIKQKGVLNIIESFNRLQSKYPNIELHMAGNGDLYDNLKDNYKNIIFYGFVGSDKVYEVLSKSHVLLMPSIHPEGLSYTLLEAGLFKNAAIATNLGAFKDVINNKENGILIDTSVESLYIAMEEMIKNEKLRNKVANNLYKTVINNYTWEVTGKKMASFIKEVTK